MLGREGRFRRGISVPRRRGAVASRGRQQCRGSRRVRSCRRDREPSSYGADTRGRQHFSNFFPLPHGQGSLRPTCLYGLKAGPCGGGAKAVAWGRRGRSRAVRGAPPPRARSAWSEKAYQPDSSPTASSSGPILSYRKPAIRSGSASVRPRSSRKTLCRRTGATLIIAKLDRLARNVAFVSNLMEAGVEFTAVDFPTANRLTIHILAAVAEHEAAMTSTRTKAALAAAKARGTKLGNPNGLTAEARTRGTAVAVARRKGQAAARVADLRPIVEEIKATGRASLRAIAAELDARGIPAPRGGRWTAPAVMRLLG